jgi:CBS domain-containing protein
MGCPCENRTNYGTALLANPLPRKHLVRCLSNQGSGEAALGPPLSLRSRSQPLLWVDRHSEIEIADPEQTVQQAAQIMAAIDAGILPVGEDDRLIGMITDRDIAIRCVAKGRGPDAKVREIMSDEVKYCFADQDIEQVAQNMAQIQVRRLPVLDRDKRLVGIVSLGDIATIAGGMEAGEALSGISLPGGQHSQSD